MPSYTEFEVNARDALSEELGVKLYESKVNINGKYKSFDIFNGDERIVGDVKNYKMTAGGNRPSAKFSTLNEYVWLMSLLEKSRNEKWRNVLPFFSFFM